VDFVDVEKRATTAAETQINKAQLRAARIPVFAAVISGLLALGAAYVTSNLTIRDEVAKLRDEFHQAKTGLEDRDTIYKVQTDLTAIREELRRVQDSMRSATTPQQNRKP
jgi:adenylosuccinate lyase